MTLNKIKELKKSNPDTAADEKIDKGGSNFGFK